MTMTYAETTLRQRCRNLCERHPNVPRLRTIAAVGAYDAEIGGSGIDSRRLTLILNYLLDSGVSVDPNFTIDTVNFREKRDWLKEEEQADLIYIGYILRHKMGLCDTFSAAEDPIPDKLNYLLSRLHYPDFWQERVKQAGTKMIVTFGGDQEIGPDFFVNGLTDLDHVVLIKPLTVEECSGGLGSEPLSKVYPGHNIDFPLPWLGFSADRQYLHAIIPALTDTALARTGRTVDKTGITPFISLPQPPTVTLSSRYNDVGNLHRSFRKTSAKSRGEWHRPVNDPKFSRR